ncbi:MAG: hypothetical protein LBE55_05625 [Clostridiales bacterium]|nr:hypothetical protein [Clostridiales bacterium]
MAVIAAAVLLFGNFGGPATVLEGVWRTEDGMNVMEFRGNRITWEEFDEVHVGTFSVEDLDFLNFIAIELLWNDGGGIPEVIDAQLVGNVMYFYPRGVLGGGTLTLHRQR